MFLNILKISASSVLKMFFNIIVSIGCIIVNTGSINTLLNSRYHGRQESNIIISKNDSKLSCTCTTLSAIMH